MRQFVVFFVCLVPLAAALPQVVDPAAADPAGSDPIFSCPVKDGNYPDPEFCDYYWTCKNGKATEKLCDDGLVYDPRKSHHADPCDSIYTVDCTNRTELQPPTNSSIYCPRRNGLFPDPDLSICDVFYTCTRGKYVLNKCSPGLHFDTVTGNCAWPDAAKRKGCGAKPKASVNGFVCPSKDVFDANGVKVINPTYPNLDDCTKFYVCLNGETPQEASCNLGLVFNERNGLCDDLAEVPECNYDLPADNADGAGV